MENIKTFIEIKTTFSSLGNIYEQTLENTFTNLLRAEHTTSANNENNTEPLTVYSLKEVSTEKVLNIIKAYNKGLCSAKEAHDFIINKA